MDAQRWPHEKEGVIRNYCKVKHLQARAALPVTLNILNELLEQSNVKWTKSNQFPLYLQSSIPNVIKIIMASVENTDSRLTSCDHLTLLELN